MKRIQGEHHRAADSRGVYCYWRRDGALGVRLARELLPDMILSDILMPGLDGYGVLATLSQERLTAAIPFIFITARVTREDTRKGMDLGADDYITKPFTRKELLNAIHTRTGKQKVLVDQISQKQTKSARILPMHCPIKS